MRTFCEIGKLRIGLVARRISRACVRTVTGDSLVHARPAVVGGGHNGVLEATRVLEVQVELAGAGVVLGGDAGADVGLELVEAVGDDLVRIVRNCSYCVALIASQRHYMREDTEDAASDDEVLQSCRWKYSWRLSPEGSRYQSRKSRQC